MREKNKKKPTKKIAICAIIYVVGIIGYAFLSYMYVNCCKHVHKQYETIKKGVIVEAELVSIEYVGGRSDSSRGGYNVWYEYIDGDIKYTGVGMYDTSYHNAKKSIGEKVDIYIDGNGLSIAVGVSPDTFEVVLMSIGMAFLLVMVFSWPFAGEKILDFFHNLGDKFSEKKDNSPLSSQIK